MNSRSAHAFHRKIQSHRNTYHRDRSYDNDAHRDYMLRCLISAFATVAEHIAEEDARLRHLPSAVDNPATRYALLGLVDMVSENMACPVDNGHDHEDFIRSWYRHSARYVDRDTPQIVRDLLAYLGLRKPDIGAY